MGLFRCKNVAKSALIGLLLGFWGFEVAFAQKINPKLDWFTLETRYFAFTYPKELHSDVVRLSQESDSIYESLQARYKAPFTEKIIVVLQSDVQSANGYFTIDPYPHLMLYVTPWTHRITESIDDELRILFTHELTHYLTLNNFTGTFAPFFKLFANRANFAGLLPFTFVEGIAILEESASGYGRLNDPIYKQSLVANRNAKKKPVPIIDVECNTVPYPYGRKPYLYGGGFLEYLNRQYGQGKVTEFYNRATGYFPYMYPHLFKDVFGVSLKKAWASFQSELQNSPLALHDHDDDPKAASGSLHRLTRTGARKSSLKFREGLLFYFEANGTDSPSLWSVDPQTEKVQKIYHNSGRTDYDVRNNQLAIVVRERTRYEVGKRVAIVDRRTKKKSFLKGIEGVQSVAFRDDETLYLVRYFGLRSEVVAYNLRSKRQRVFLASDERFVYGNLTCNDEFVAVEVRRRQSPYRSEVWVFDHSKQRQLRLNHMKRIIHPVFEAANGSSRLLFSGLEDRGKTYAIYAYDFGTSELSLVRESTSHLLSPAVGVLANRDEIKVQVQGAPSVPTNTYFAFGYSELGRDVVSFGANPRPAPNAEGLLFEPVERAEQPSSEAETLVQSPTNPRFERNPWSMQPWHPVRPKYRAGLNHLNLFTDVGAYRFEWVQAPLLLSRITVDAGFYYDSWAPYFKIAYETEAQKNNLWRLQMDRLYRYETYSMDRFALNHNVAFNRNSFFFRMDETMTAGYLLNTFDVEEDKPKPSRAWNPFLPKHERSWRYLFAERIQFGIYQKRYMDLVPYKALYAELGGLFYTSQYWGGRMRPFANASIRGFKRIFPSTTLSANLKTIYAYGGPYMSSDGIPIAVRLMTNRSHENIQFRTRTSVLDFARGLGSLEVGFHQKVLQIRRGMSYYFPFYFQNIWLSGYAKAGRLYDRKEPERNSALFYEWVGQATLELTLFYHVKQYVHYFAFVDPENWGSFQHLLSFQFRLPI